MAAFRSLRHTTFVTDGALHFYDGSARVAKGVVRLPLSKAAWFMKAWFDGYRIDAESGEPILSVEEYVRFWQGEAGVDPEE